MSTHKWYIAHTAAGAERRVKKNLLDVLKRLDKSEKVSEIIVPSIKVSDKKRGKDIVVEKKIMSGYILFKMEEDENIWHMIKSIPGVTNFIGSTGDHSGKPIPVPDEQIEEILNNAKDQIKENDKRFEVGDKVTIVDGYFSSFSGVVEEVDSEKQELKVSILIFKRSTLIKLNFSQVVSSNES